MIWLIGAGLMAKDYAKVLKALEISFIVIGRSEDHCRTFEEEMGCQCISGGIEKFLANKPNVPSKAILAVGIESLSKITELLVDYGVKEILLEKPGVAYPSEIFSLATIVNNKKARVVLAYNRRFYASVFKAEEIIQQDGGVTSFTFEFTEWSHVISGLKKTNQEWNNWFLGNSTHVIDTAFFIGGKPDEMASYYKGSLSWHPSSSIFTGAGVSDKGALFSYHANWEAPGRFVIEFLTRKHRLIFRPLETLQIQEIGSVALNPVEIEDKLDKEFKPGVFLQTKAFIEGQFERFCTLQEQREMIERYYLSMSGYKK